MADLVEIDTWECPECGYKQDFDPSNPVLMAKHFPGIAVGMCPACYMGKSKTTKKEKIRRAVPMGQILNAADKSKVEVATDAEIDDVEELSDEHKTRLKDKAKKDRQKYNIS